MGVRIIFMKEPLSYLITICLIIISILIIQDNIVSNSINADDTAIDAIIGAIDESINAYLPIQRWTPPSDTIWFPDPNAREIQQAGAYMAIFKEFYPTSRISLERGEAFYVSVDLSGIQYNYRDIIMGDIEYYVRGSRVILLWDDMNDLIKSGYILTTDDGEPMIFENGELFSYKDIRLTDTLLETEASTWSGNLAGIGATYRVELNTDVRKWEITSVTNSWIS